MKWIRAASNLPRLFHLVQFVKCWQIFLDLNFKELYQSSRKEKESWCLVFTSSTKRETRHFHVLRNVPKSVMYVQSCCLPIKPVAFCRFRCRRRRRRLCSLVKNSVRRITEEKKGECLILSLCNAYLTLGGMAFPDRLLIACFATSILNSIKLSLKTDRERFNTSNTLRHQQVGYRATYTEPRRIQLWLK